MEDYEINELAQQPWEETFDLLTADMDPHSIDICVLADRYRNYIKEMQQFDLEVPARAIRVCSALLKIKTLALTGEDPLKEEEEMNPMNFDEPIEDVNEDEPTIEENTPQLNVPVKPKPKRRMSLNELKTALNDAMDVKERRDERQEMREEIDQHFEVDEQSLEDKINSLFTTLTSFVSRGGKEDKVHFDKLIENNESEERIEKFLHVLQLENEERVKCIQEDLLSDLHVKPNEEVTN